MLKFTLIFSLVFLLQVPGVYSQNVKPIYVIVHGAWGGGWAFKKVDSLLREKGCIVYRPTLTGQGEKVHLASANVGLSTHINDVVNVILFENLSDIILVGHSYGGMVVSGVADSLAGKIKKLIYLDAFVPENGESLVSIQGDRANRLTQMAKNGFIVPAWVTADRQPPKDVPHSLKTLTDTLVLNNPLRTKIPTTYILTVAKGMDPKNDDFAAQAERARRKGWPIFQLEADHNPQWSAPENFVDMLENIRKQ
jgi:pimeloyl-ACP methyl ester carboxylesterase